MTHTPLLLTPPEPAPLPHQPDAAAADAARTARHLRVLQEVTELCLDAARHVQAALKTHDTPSGQPARALARLADAVRQTTALEAKLARDHRDRILARNKAAALAAKSRHERQCRALRLLVDPLLAAAPTTPALRPKAFETRMANMDLDPDFLARPLAETARALCRDLGLPLPNHTPPPASPAG